MVNNDEAIKKKVSKFTPNLQGASQRRADASAANRLAATDDLNSSTMGGGSKIPASRLRTGRGGGLNASSSQQRQGAQSTTGNVSGIFSHGIESIRGSSSRSGGSVGAAFSSIGSRTVAAARKYIRDGSGIDENNQDGTPIDLEFVTPMEKIFTAASLDTNHRPICLAPVSTLCSGENSTSRSDISNSSESISAVNSSSELVGSSDSSISMNCIPAGPFIIQIPGVSSVLTDLHDHQPHQHNESSPESSEPGMKNTNDLVQKVGKLFLHKSGRVSIVLDRSNDDSIVLAGLPSATTCLNKNTNSGENIGIQESSSCVHQSRHVSECVRRVISLHPSSEESAAAAYDLGRIEEHLIFTPPLDEIIRDLSIK